MSDSDSAKKAGTAEFKTVKAGCGIRFDPDILDEDSGFDFSAAEQLKQESLKDEPLKDEQLKKEPSHTGHSPPDSSGT